MQVIELGMVEFRGRIYLAMAGSTLWRNHPCPSLGGKGEAKTRRSIGQMELRFASGTEGFAIR